MAEDEMIIELLLCTLCVKTCHYVQQYCCSKALVIWNVYLEIILAILDAELFTFMFLGGMVW